MANAFKTNIKLIDIFKDEHISDAKGIKIIMTDGTEFSYNTHDYSMGVHKEGFHSVYYSNVVPDDFWNHVHNYRLTGA